MSSVSSDALIPSPLADYKSPPNLRFSPQVWDAVFKSIGERLRTLEAMKVTLQATIDTLQSQALDIVSSSVSAEITNQRAKLALLNEQLQAVDEAYQEIVGGGVFADTMRLRVRLNGAPDAATVQAGLEAIVARLDAQRSITVAALFIGAS